MIEEKLEGVSLKDRHKNLNHLISNFKIEDFTSDYINSLLSGNRIDKIFLAALANRFTNGTIICELFKSEDEIVVSKALKSKWFFEGINNRDLLNPTYFLTSIFPFASFSTRCKLITNLGTFLKDQTLAENFHKSLAEKYGRDFVAKLLPVCSENFIINELEIKGFTISELQLKYIYNKYPKLVINLMKKHVKNNEFAYLFSSHTIEFMIRDYPEDFIEIYNIKPFHNFTLGYRTTLSLLKYDKQFSIDNASKLYCCLDIAALLKILKGDERDRFFINIFPSKKSDFAYQYSLEQIFKYFKPEYKIEYLMKIYNKVYENEDFIKNNHLPYSLVEYLPCDIRTEWAKNKMSQEKSAEEDYLKYLSIDRAIKRMMELNNSTPNVDKRSKLLQSMIDCCKMNKNTEILLNVLKYVAKRHRNDLERLRHDFLQHLHSSFTLHKLSSEHWDVIYEMIKIMIYNDEIVKNYRQHFLSSILEEMIHFRIINNMEFESIIDIMIDQKLNTLNLLTEYPEYEKIVFDAFLKKFQNLIQDKPLDDDVKIKIKIVFNAFTNTQKKKNIPKLKEVPWLLNALTLCMNERDENGLKNYDFIYIMNQNSEAKKIFSEIIFKHKLNNTIFKNVLIHNAKLIYDNIDYVTSNIFKELLQEYSRTLPLIKSYMSESLGASFVHYIQNRIPNHEEELPEELAKLIICLSFLIDTNDVQKILMNYLPGETRIEVSENPIVRIEYRRTLTLANNFKYIMPPLSFDLISHFSQGDYFKYGLPTILHMCYKKQEDVTLPFIKELSQKPVSVKKHSIRLAYFLFSKNESLAIYNEMWSVEKNSSIRDVLFQRTHKIFEKETNSKIVDEAFSMIKTFYKSFQECDRNLYSYLGNCPNVKKDYIAEYCVVAWNTLKMLEKSNVTVDGHLRDLIYTATRNMEVLNEEFCANIINEYLQCLGNSKASHVDALSSFCITYLMSMKSAETQRKHISEFFSIFKTFMSQKWDSVEYRRDINAFLKCFCTETLNFNYSVHPLSLLTHLYDMISSQIPFEAAPELYLVYQFTLSFIKLLQKPLKVENEIITTVIIEFIGKYSECIVEHLESYSTAYGTEIIDVFASSLQFILDTYHGNGPYLKLHFIQQLLRCNNKSKQLMLVIINLLPIIYKDDLTGLEMQKSLLSEISLCKDPAVKTKLGLKFHMPLSYFVD